MDFREFQAKNDARVMAVFVTVRDLKLNACLWDCGCNPNSDPQPITIPAGTEFFGSGWTAYPDGHAMVAVKPYTVFKGLTQRKNRWVRIGYVDMVYSHHALLSEQPINLRTGG